MAAATITAVMLAAAATITAAMSVVPTPTIAAVAAAADTAAAITKKAAPALPELLHRLNRTPALPTGREGLAGLLIEKTTERVSYD